MAAGESDLTIVINGRRLGHSERVDTEYENPGNGSRTADDPIFLRPVKKELLCTGAQGPGHHQGRAQSGEKVPPRFVSRIEVSEI